MGGGRVRVVYGVPGNAPCVLRSRSTETGRKRQNGAPRKGSVRYYVVLNDELDTKLLLSASHEDLLESR